MAHTLPQFIRTHRDQIVDEWAAEASHLPSARDLSTKALKDHIPEFLDRLAIAIERDDQTASMMDSVPNLHAALRSRAGYDLRQVIGEYRLIRSAILRMYQQLGDISEDSRPKLKPLSTMSHVIDLAIADAVDHYAIDNSRAREMFIGMLGHDLRDPLNVVAIIAQRMLDRGDELDTQTKAYAARLAASARRMDAMIRDLLDFARGRLGGGFPIVPTPCDARELIVETVGDIAHAHPDRSIVCLAADAVGDFGVTWDSDRIAQAITNLVSNAISHGQDPVAIELFDRGESVVIEVRNAGEVPAAALRTIFAPFSQPEHDRRHDSDRVAAERRRGHLGLGLYIVYEIAKAHGGEVTARSTNGQTVFELTLPRSVTEGEG